MPPLASVAGISMRTGLPARLRASAFALRGCGPPREFSTHPARVSDGLLASLERCARVSTNPSILDRHGDDESHHPSVPPAAVVFATSTEEVQAIVRVCAESRTPLIPFGAGTSLEGHITAIHGGVCLDLSEMNSVLEVNEDDMDCRVQAGVTRLSINEHLRATGLHFPVDPGADCSIGGMVATGASGTSTVRYGTMRENTLGLSAVLASGEVVRTGGRARKSSAGYDLTRLLIGSEGTLGVVTEVQLKLHPTPSAVSAATCSFPDLVSAASAVTALLQCGVPLARSELLHSSAIAAFNAYARDVADLEEKPVMLPIESNHQPCTRRVSQYDSPALHPPRLSRRSFKSLVRADPLP